MLVRAEFTEMPKEILIESHEDNNFVWLRKNIEVVEEEDTTKYVADEVFFKANVSESDVEEKFDAYFTYGISWQEDTSMPTLEERVSALEDMLLGLL